MDDRSAFQRFISELRRRHVPQTAAVYLVAAWAVIEFSDVVVPNLNGPQWVVTAVIVAALVGFPAVLVLAWLFDWGPEGIHRTADEDALPPGHSGAPGSPAARGSSAPWMAAVAVLVVAVGSAVAVAALLAGDGEPATEAAGEPAAAGSAEGGEADAPAPPSPPRIRGVEGLAQADSIIRAVERSLGTDFEGLARLEVLQNLDPTQLDSADVAELRQIGRAAVREAGLHILIGEPVQWRVSEDGEAPLPEGETLAISGVAQDAAGVVSVSVDGEVVAEAESPRETLVFTATLRGTGSAGVREVPIVLRTADGREVRQLFRVLQQPGGTP